MTSIVHTATVHENPEFAMWACDLPLESALSSTEATISPLSFRAEVNLLPNQIESELICKPSEFPCIRCIPCQ